MELLFLASVAFVLLRALTISNGKNKTQTELSWMRTSLISHNKNDSGEKIAVKKAFDHSDVYVCTSSVI